VKGVERPRQQAEAPRPRRSGVERTKTPIMNPAARPGAARRDTPPLRHDTPIETQEMPAVEPPEPEVVPEEPPALDPYKILGIVPGVAFDEVKKAYRALILQYHPDKVAHLAPEFRALAETRTRDLNAAYEALEKALRT